MMKKIMTDIDKLRKEYRYETGSTWNMTHEWYSQWLEKELLKARTELKNNGGLGDVRLSVCSVCGKKFGEVKKCHNVKCTNPFQTES